MITLKQELKNTIETCAKDILSYGVCDNSVELVDNRIEIMKSAMERLKNEDESALNDDSIFDEF